MFAKKLLLISVIIASLIVIVPPWKVAKYEAWPEMEKLIHHDLRNRPIPGTWSSLNWAPLWNPPSSFISHRSIEGRNQPVILAPVRWPWMTKAAGHYLEIDHSWLAAILSFLTIGIGVVASGKSFFSNQRQHGVLNVVLISLGGGQICAWFVYILLGLMSMGFAWNDVTFYLTMLAGIAASAVHLAIVHKTQIRAESKIKSPMNSSSLRNEPVRSPDLTSRSRDCPNLGWSFFGFILALAVSFLFLVVTTQLGKPFMGPDIGGAISPYGGVRKYESIINKISAILIISTGCWLGNYFRKKQLASGFGYGLIVGCIAAGVLKFIQF